MADDPIDNFVVFDKGDDFHFCAALRAEERINFNLYYALKYFWSSASKGLSQLGKTIVSFYKGYVPGILTLLYAIENVLLIPGDVAQMLEIFFNVFFELNQAFLKFVIIVKTESRIMMASGLLEKPI